MHNGYAKRAEVLKVLKSTLPISVAYEDPMQPGAQITCQRDDIIKLLSMSDDVLGDSQWVAPLYAEMSRFEHAALFAAEKADSEYRRWKAARAHEFRERHKDGKITEKAVEEYYRTHADYEANGLVPERLRAQAGIFGGIRESLSIKSKMLDAAVRNVRSYEQALRTEDNSADRFSDLENLQKDALAVAAASTDAANRLTAGLSPVVSGPPKRVTRRARLET